ncbi:hypothetical protein FRB94_010521 [Tulasnella sp. JGI-2019a]|nr:hypothetical protein FRB94_010521 [Tulasnella sp. JGI-2019a]
MSEAALNVANQIRQTLSGKEPTLAVCVSTVAAFAVEATPNDVETLEDLLQEIYRASIDQSDIAQFASFISILHSLLPALPAASIITTWFDILLRASFRTPQLPRSSVRKARDLVLHGLDDETHPKTASFRRMIIDLYLSGASKESSGDEALEDVALDSAEQQKLRCWKQNLEDALLADAIRYPKSFFTQIDDAFQSPPSRLQLVVLLSQLIRLPNLAIKEFSASPLYSSLLNSLQLDFSTTVLTVGISVLITTLPNMAYFSPVILNDSLPRLLSILCRVLCWKERPSPNSLSPPVEQPMGFRNPTLPIQPKETGRWKRHDLAPHVKWTRLESTFDLSAAPPPDVRLYFQFLYGLWPTTVLSFLRRPLTWLKNVDHKSPYVDEWEDVIDVDEVRSRVKPILRTHVIHPSIILRDSADESSNLSRWSVDGMNVSGIVSECITLDVRNAAAAYPSGSSKNGRQPPLPATAPPSALGITDTGNPTGYMSPSDTILTAAKIAVPSLSPDVGSPTADKSPPIQELISNQMILKSTSIGLDAVSTSLRDAVIESAIGSPTQDDLSATPHPHPSRIHEYFENAPSSSHSPSHPSTPLSSHLSREPSSPPQLFSSPLPMMTPGSSRASPRPRFRALALMGNEVNDTTAQQALEVISSLQREVLLLRNELNFELWLKKQHLSNMGKLHRDRILARREEAERQNLHNTLKQHKASLQMTHEELKTLKAEQAAAKVKHNEWVQILQSKLTGYREEKKSWLAQAVELRGAVSEAKAMMASQKAILDETDTERFNLRNELNDVMPKVLRIQDYERTIEHMTKQQLTCLERRVSSPSPTALHRSHTRSFSQAPGGQTINVNHEKFLALETEHLNIKTKNLELEDKVEELEAMVEYLKYEVKQRAGGWQEGHQFTYHRPQDEKVLRNMEVRRLK